jgi:GntR family histidine utilization transcriptional repressor
MERRTWSSGAAVTYVRLVYPGNSHWLVARFEPSHGNANAMRTAP